MNRAGLFIGCFRRLKSRISWQESCRALIIYFDKLRALFKGKCERQLCELDYRARSNIYLCLWFQVITSLLMLMIVITVCIRMMLFVLQLDETPLLPTALLAQHLKAEGSTEQTASKSIRKMMMMTQHDTRFCHLRRRRVFNRIAYQNTGNIQRTYERRNNNDRVTGNVST